MNDRSICLSRGDANVKRLAFVSAMLLGVAHASSSWAGEDRPGPRYEAGSTTFCVLDPSRGFDDAGGVTDGQRLIIVEAWYPIEQRAARHHPQATFADYFARDRELMLRTERTLLSRS